MRPVRLAFTTLFLFIFSTAFSQEKFSKIKVYHSSEQERNELLALLQVDHFIPETNAFVSEINAKDIELLKARKKRYKIIVDDVAKNLEMLNRQYYADIANAQLGRVALEQPGSAVDKIIKTPAAFEVKSTFGGYYSFAEMEAAMNNLVSTYPLIASKTSIGKTSEGRDLWLIKISDNVATDEANEPEVIYLGLQHAREAITGSSMIFLMQYLCENYSADNRIKDLVDNRELYIIPCFNPDGWEYNRLNGGAGSGWRKNRSKVDSTKRGQSYTYEYGVDLNRNWGVDWGNCSAPILGSSTSCGSSTVTDETYYGPNAFSELETQAVRAFAKSHHLAAGFDQHAYGPYYSLPFGRKSLHQNQMPQKGVDFFTAIPALMGTYNGMRAADSYDALAYEVAGGFKDWMLMGEIGVGTGTGLKDTVWAMTGEGAAGGGSGGTYSDFWAPASQIINLSKGMCYQNLQLAFAAGTYVDIQDGNSLAISSKTGTLNCKIKRLGLGNNPVNISLIPLENMQGGTQTNTISSMTYYEDRTISFAYNLSSSITNGQRIKYALQVTTSGYSYSDTVIKLFNPTILLSDDMEGNFSTNWTATSNVTDGWAFTTLSAFGGLQSMTESPAGNYTTSTTRTVTNKNVFDLSNNTAAYLNFWTKYRAENFRDKLQVQVSTNSTNGTDGTWVAISGTSTIQEPGTLDGATLNGQPGLTGIKDYWTQNTFDVSAYKNSNFRFRFVFTSDGDPSSFKFEKDDGFYIDNLSLVKSTSALVNTTPLPVSFINFYGTLLPNKTVQLNWEAIADEHHDHFEIERSVNGGAYTNLGRSNPVPPYQFIDAAPATGNNYYRVKQVDKDGKVSYSKVINIVVKPEVMIAFYPNPVSDQLNLKIAAATSSSIRISITDLLGKEVFAKNVVTDLSQEEMPIDVKRLSGQVYILKAAKENGELISAQKFIKL